MAWPSRSDALSALPAPETAPARLEGEEVDGASAAQNLTKSSSVTVHVGYNRLGLGTMEHSKTHPRALASLGTAHTWAFGALAEVGTTGGHIAIEFEFESLHEVSGRAINMHLIL